MAASKNEEVEPSALPTIFSVENEEHEIAELRALIKLSPLLLLSTHPTTTFVPSELIAITLTELVELNVSGVPNNSPPSEDFAKYVL